MNDALPAGLSALSGPLAGFFRYIEKMDKPVALSSGKFCRELQVFFAIRKHWRQGRLRGVVDNVGFEPTTSRV